MGGHCEFHENKNIKKIKCLVRESNLGFLFFATYLFPSVV